MAGRQLRRDHPRPGAQARPAQTGDPRQPRRLLGLEEAAVNVKAKTGEHVGPIGRGEAIVCEAVVLIELSDVGLSRTDHRKVLSDIEDPIIPMAIMCWTVVRT